MDEISAYLIVAENSRKDAAVYYPMRFLSLIMRVIIGQYVLEGWVKIIFRIISGFIYLVVLFFCFLALVKPGTAIFYKDFQIETGKMLTQFGYQLPEDWQFSLQGE
ncbi:MAG: hypothetical protein RBT34_05605 [Anaerolineaceae bacterium]|jgi:hypothetical protein|nr:hypothetical protein [Anaerolineaceae bacterium]